MNKLNTPGRPKWDDTSTYPSHIDWSFSNWAWEFLRRNESFQQGCERHQKSPSSVQNAFANTFGLQKFKTFRESFGAGEVPEWLSVLPNVLVRATKAEGQLQEAVVRRGRVVLSFDLDEMLKNRPTLDAQVFNAGFYLNDCLREYAGLLKSKIRSPRPQKAKLFKYLRVLDATVLADKVTPAAIAAVLYPGQCGVENHYSGEGKIEHHRKVAQSLVESGYLELPAKDYQTIKKK